MSFWVDPHFHEEYTSDFGKTSQMVCIAQRERVLY